MKMHHLAIMVRNLAESIAFYEEMVELTIARRISADPYEVVYLKNRDEDTQVELIYNPHVQKFEAKGLTICFETDHLDAVHARATEKGRNPSDIRNPDPENRYFYVYDPDGASVQFKQIVG